MPTRTRKPRPRRLAREGDVQALAAALLWRRWSRAGRATVRERGGDVRLRIVEVLAAMEGEAALAALVPALDDPDDRVRVRAIRALAAAPGGRVAIAEALARWLPGGAPAVHREALAALAVDGERSVRFLARASLAQDRPFDPTTRGALEELAEGAEDSDLAWRGILFEALAAPLAGARTRAMIEFAAARDDGLLLALLRSPERRVGAVAALGSLRAATGLDALVELARSEDPQTRREVALALGRIRHPLALPSLETLARDPDAAVRAQAKSALDDFGAIAIALRLAADGERLPPA